MLSKNITTITSSIFLILTALCSVGLSASASADEGIRWLNRWDASCYQEQNNINSCRNTWYKTTQGSHLLMWEVFKTIEMPNSRELFSERNSLSQYGFLYPEALAYNATTPYNGSYGERVERDVSVNGMPIGFLKDKSQLDDRNYLGFTCAACHTGKVSYGDNEYFVEGGQANADVATFLIELADALEANKNDSSKRRRFKDRFKSYVRSNRDWSARYIWTSRSERYLDDAIAYVRGFTNRNQNTVANGPSRLDAIGSILNQLHVSYTGKDDSEALPLTAPVSVPYIWDVSELECVQTNCISNVPIDRNVGEVLGVFGYVNIDEDENVVDLLELAFRAISPLFDHTAKVDNMFDLESSLAKVSPPKWPNSFPPLNPTQVMQGKQLYAENCAGCHVDTSDGIDDSELTAPNSIGRRYTKITRIPYAEIGTDPAFAVDYGKRKAKTGIIGAVLTAVAPDSVDPDTGLTFGEKTPEELNALVLLGVAANVITDDHFNSLGFRHRAEEADRSLPADEAVEALKTQYKGGHVDRNLLTPTSYRAKPLDGIAFTGPYLHNGSVRTLSDLLKRPEDRPTEFQVGTTQYDVANAGYKNAGSFRFDTTIRGNSKDGHDYATGLSEQDKEALLEYLKSL